MAAALAAARLVAGWWRCEHVRVPATTVTQFGASLQRRVTTTHGIHDASANTRAVASSAPESTMLPSGLTARSCTALAWPYSCFTQLAVRRSHSRTTPSSEPVTTSGCCGSHAMRVTGCDASRCVSGSGGGRRVRARTTAKARGEPDTRHTRHAGMARSWACPTLLTRTCSCWQTPRWLKLPVSQMMSFPSMPAVAASGRCLLKPAASTESSCPAQKSVHAQAARERRAKVRAPGKSNTQHHNHATAHSCTHCGGWWLRQG